MLSCNGLDALASLSRRCGKGARRAIPGRRDDAHADHLLGGPQEVHATRDGPPAVACLLEKSATTQPFFLCERRRIAIETATGHLESEQREPILEAIQRDEAAIPWRSLLASEVAFHP